MPRGGFFLLESQAPEDIFTPEDFTEEQKAIAKTTEEFWNNEVAPHLEEIQHQHFDVLKKVLRKSAELGLTAVFLPEKYGGMEMDFASMMIVSEGLARDGSYATCHGAQAGIGTLPILLFGTEQQKRKYLPRLATAELIAAYALTEPQAGSDALAARTRADISADGTHYVLNGQKMWITNGGIADLYTVFAKVGGEKFTAFLIERQWPGVKPGAEEKKMGLKGSSTTAVYFDNVKVPVENVLGEIGRGHIIAFNILNIGRLVLGVFAHGGARDALADSIRYAKERKAFGKSIAEFGLIQEKLAEMATRIYVNESMAYRVVGEIQTRLEGLSWDAPDAAQRVLKAVEEYAVECSFVKVFGSEMLDYVVDEGVQIHGGYGYHQDYSVERAYRDSRINRIFEGTNEINRLLATGMLLKRARRVDREGRVLPLVDAVKKLQVEILSGAGESDIIANSKKIALLLLGVAYEKFREKIEEQQEVIAGISDVLMNAYAMESALLRSKKSGRENASDMAAVFADEAMTMIESAARTVLAACSEGDALRANLAVLRRFARREPVNSIALRRRTAARLIEAARYVSGL
ncbi:MAG TPA: acyl-CoA dehydrogenase family protein [Bryobacteraceae bacterium]|jgi:alkylation response protein AidB-like acyl-CoA dehydrogenase